jgi:hypothetical protein
MKTIETASTTTWYQITEETAGRTATIYFTDGVFSHCQYAMGHLGQYTLDDWHFLGMVARRIGELAKDTWHFF